MNLHRTALESAISRRQLLGGLAIAGSGLVVTRPFAFAQTPDASPSTETLAPGTALWPKLNLNAASNEQFAAIPGVTDRMLDEFNEYKPYASILEFRQEIGKYVDETQVAAW